MPEDQINDLLEQKIVLALEAAPRPEISPGFVARVAAQLPPRGMQVVPRARYSRAVGVACLVILLPLMFAFADRATGTSVYWLSIDTIFCAQFALLAVWLVASTNS